MRYLSWLIRCLACVALLAAAEAGAAGGASSNGPFYGAAGGGGGAHPTDTTLALDDDVQFQLGTGTDAWFEWDTATTPDQLSLNNTDCDGGGTNCVIFYTEAGSPNLFLRNGEFIQNETDGKITLGGSGGTNNEDLTIDFESNANQVNWSSTTGATAHRFDGPVVSLTDMRVTNTGAFYFNARSRIESPADGQFNLENAAGTSGAVLDVDDAADTIVVKDQAGTGNGNLTVTGLSTLTGGAVLPVQTAATPSAPATCDATSKGRIEVVDDSDDGAGTQVCYCGMTDDTTYDWLNLTSGAACTFY